MDGRRAPPGEGLDAERVLRLAALHGVTPLLARQVEAGSVAVPEALRIVLRERAREWAVRGFAFVEEMVAIARAFRAEGVTALPWKGPLLALSAYGSPVLREYSDLDFLLPRRDVPRAEEVLLARGYRRERTLSPAETAAQFRDYCDLKFLHGTRPLAVEIHWEVVPRFLGFRFGGGDAASRRRVRIGGEEVTTLSAEDEILVLAVHGVKHAFERLVWIADLARLAHRRDGLDWPALLRRARGAGVARMLRVALAIAADTLGAALPAPARADVDADPAARPLAAAAARHLFADPPGVPGVLGRALFYLRCRERPRDALAGALRLALTPTLREWETLRLPRGLFFLHHLRRPGRLIREACRGRRGPRP